LWGGGGKKEKTRLVKVSRREVGGGFAKRPSDRPAKNLTQKSYKPAKGDQVIHSYLALGNRSEKRFYVTVGKQSGRGQKNCIKMAKRKNNFLRGQD